jgi:hypothetical protein
MFGLGDGCATLQRVNCLPPVIDLILSLYHHLNHDVNARRQVLARASQWDFQALRAGRPMTCMYVQRCTTKMSAEPSAHVAPLRCPQNQARKVAVLYTCARLSCSFLLGF